MSIKFVLDLVLHFFITRIIVTIGAMALIKIPSRPNRTSLTTKLCLIKRPIIQMVSANNGDAVRSATAAAGELRRPSYCHQLHPTCFRRFYAVKVFDFDSEATVKQNLSPTSINILPSIAYTAVGARNHNNRDKLLDMRIYKLTNGRY